MSHPAFPPMPDGRPGIILNDRPGGSHIPTIPVHVDLQVSAKTVVHVENGPPLIMDLVDALSLQTTAANHWHKLWQAQQEEIANLRAQLNEAQGEGRVYELPADIAVTTEEFAQLKDIQRALSNHFDIDDADGIEQLAARIHGDPSINVVMRPMPGELETALRKLGVSTVGGLHSFLEFHKLYQEAKLVDG